MAELRNIRQVYGKPWSKLSKVKLSKEVLLKVGDIIIEEIEKEARKDFARTGKTPRGVAMGMPDTKRFFESFSVDILGESTIVIRSSWPWVERHMEGRKPFKMRWLTQQNGVFRVPIVTADGSVVVVTTPKTATDAWIHPGVRKMHWVSRGVQKGRARAAREIVKEMLRQSLSGNVLK